jgi:hypothetical protein
MVVANVSFSIRLGDPAVVYWFVQAFCLNILP